MNKYEKYRCLDDVKKKVRIKIMDFIIEKNGPVNIEETKNYIETKMGLEKDYVEEVVNQFVDTNVMVADEENINFIFPVSGYETNHKITLQDGRKFNAMCAIDSIGTSYTFDQSIEINSACSSTGKEICLKVDSGNVEYVNNPDLRVIHINLEKHSEWASSC